MIRDQLLHELWAAYPDVIIDICEVDPVRIVVRGHPDWKDVKGVVAAHRPDPDWGVVVEVDPLAEVKARLEAMENLPTPEDIPIREKVTGNIYVVRVEDGRLKLYDVDDKLVKSWWEVWK